MDHLRIKSKIIVPTFFRSSCYDLHPVQLTFLHRIFDPNAYRHASALHMVRQTTLSWYHPFFIVSAKFQKISFRLSKSEGRFFLSSVSVINVPQPIFQW